MDSLESLFSVTSLGGGVQRISGILKVYISEVSSPTKLWIQLAESNELDDLIRAMGKFYSNNDFWTMQPNQIYVGMRIAAFSFGEWDRAEVISEYNASTECVKLFFIDYGTTGNLNIKHCKFLFEQFSVPTRKALRGTLFGVQPSGKRRLWDLKVTDAFINNIKNKVHRIEIVKYHNKDDSYEFLLYDSTSATVNYKMIQSGIAESIKPNDVNPLCLTYPSFDMLEKLVTYPTFGERFSVLERTGINLNDFEDTCIPETITDAQEFEKKLDQVLSDERLTDMKRIFQELRQC